MVEGIITQAELSGTLNPIQQKGMYLRDLSLSISSLFPVHVCLNSCFI